MFSSLCLDLIQRSLSHERVTGCKAPISWGHLWKALVNTSSFLAQHAQLYQPTEILPVAEKVSERPSTNSL